MQGGFEVKDDLAWTLHEVAKATSGRWLIEPQFGWRATGLAIAAQTFKAGDMIVVARHNEERGLSLQGLQRLATRPSAIITSADVAELRKFETPLLLVEDTGKAILNLGHNARDRFRGRVFGVTGSAGKTTCVAMLSHALSPYGKTQHSAHNANLPHGIAWNLASFDLTASNIVLEMAIGRMGVSSRMARPHVAIFTNIQPVHLTETNTTKDIANTKSAIFWGMKPGDIAIINRDMLEWDTVFAAATKAKLRVVHFGQSDACDYQILKYDAQENLVRVKTPYGIREYKLGAAGHHMALNSIAVLAALESAGLDPGAALASFSTFGALAGRGESLQICIGGKNITVIDDAYNANPGSMTAALNRLSEEKTKGRRIAVLGQMAELGKDAERYHTELATLINKLPIDKVYIYGELYTKFWEALADHRRGHFAQSLTDLREYLLAATRSDDTILLKGSNSTRVHEIVESLKAKATIRSALNVSNETSALLLRWSDGQILFNQGADLKHPPASIAKIVTLCLVQRRMEKLQINGETTVPVSEAATDIQSLWGFRAGNPQTLATLIKANAIISANEASNALAEWHSGSIAAFVEEMNSYARSVGMRETLFCSPSGIGIRQKTTTGDLAILAGHVHANFPALLQIFAQKDFHFEGKTYLNINPFLGHSGITGLKTGSLGPSRHHVVLTRTVKGELFICVILSAQSKQERQRIGDELLKACLPL